MTALLIIIMICDETASPCLQALVALVAFLDRCIDQEQDKLSDYGADRTFLAFSRIMDSLYLACKEITLSDANADTQVRGAGSSL